MILNTLKNKILFIFERCEYNDNKVSTSKNLSFLSITLFIIITRSFKFTIKNELNKNNFDINFSKDIKKRLILIFKTFKKKKFKSLISSTLLKLTHQLIII